MLEALRNHRTKGDPDMFGEGFIPGSRASFFLDFLACSLVVVVFMQALSISLVKHFRLYKAHKRLQVAISVILLVLIVCFEFEVRFMGWRHRASVSPVFETWLMPVLIVHILIAISFLLLGFVTMRNALLSFSKSPQPSVFSPVHKRQARLAVLAMAGTVLSGWLFYYLAFIVT